jgi:hypothetical protein
MFCNIIFIHTSIINISLENTHTYKGSPKYFLWQIALQGDFYFYFQNSGKFMNSLKCLECFFFFLGTIFWNILKKNSSNYATVFSAL